MRPIARVSVRLILSCLISLSCMHVGAVSLSDPAPVRIAEGTRLCDQAEKLQAEAKYAEALAVYRQVLEFLPTSPRAKGGLAACEARLQSKPPAAPLVAVGRLIEAEDYESISQSMTRLNDAEASGRTCVGIPLLQPHSQTEGAPPRDSGNCAYRLTVRVAGQYRFWARTWWTDSTGNSFFLKIFDKAVVLGQDASYGRWHWVRGPVVDLQPGPLEISVQNREDGAKLDQFLVTPDLDYVPGGDCYVVTDLGAPTGLPKDRLVPLDVNGGGLVTGYHHSEKVPLFIWQKGRFVLLPPSPDVTSCYPEPFLDGAGHVIRNCVTDKNGASRPAVWDGTRWSLLDPPAGLTSWVAKAAGPSGTIVGLSGKQPVIWRKGVAKVLPLPEGAAEAAAVAIAGERILGLCTIGKGFPVVHRLAVWDDRGVQLLSAPPDNLELQAEMYGCDINAAGDVVAMVGFADTSQGGLRACLWRNGKPQMVPFETARPGSLGRGVFISDAGQVFAAGMVWDAQSGARLLDSLLAPASMGWQLQRIHAINAAGQIVGCGKNPDGEACSYMASPVTSQ